MESENDGNRIDTPDETPVDEEQHGQETVAEDLPPDVKNIPLFGSSRKEDQRPPIDFKSESRSLVEGNEVHLVVYDVIHRDEPDEIAARGPVSVQRVLALHNDLEPYLGDIIGFKEIGFVIKTDIAEDKRNLNAEYLEGLILSFNCCLDYKKWTKIQVMEFFCQLVTPVTTTKLVEKVTAGSNLSMFQEEGYFEEINNDSSIINLDQFLIIHQEIEKLNRFQ
ncbi:hypothetical protein L3Y34_011148 [Caenorhabditis briggsae]|uniref:Uncharacterized protein n=1 Tax=Caenorhabditis briggsae TaxID=6238 RepID=A0AAE8ZPF7_CAEBR|nr:hypothetical protein L3Y34_011148 [Caenorhabditis briggsae]